MVKNLQSESWLLPFMKRVACSSFFLCMAALKSLCGACAFSVYCIKKTKKYHIPKLIEKCDVSSLYKVTKGVNKIL
jgi:hypothetical protein